MNIIFSDVFYLQASPDLCISSSEKLRDQVCIELHFTSSCRSVPCHCIATIGCVCILGDAFARINLLSLRSMGGGNVLHVSVILFTGWGLHGGGGGGDCYKEGDNRLHPLPPLDTVNRRSVRILLEYTLLHAVFWSCRPTPPREAIDLSLD